MRDLILALPHTNYWTLGISLSSILFLSVGRDYINPWFKKRSPVPLPIELILVCVAKFCFLFGKSLTNRKSNSIKTVVVNYSTFKELLRRD